MSKVLKKFEPSGKKGPDPKYNWDLWLNGQIHQLIKGEDFDCTFDSMEWVIRKTAKRRGKSVSVFLKYDDDGEKIGLVIKPRQ